MLITLSKREAFFDQLARNPVRSCAPTDRAAYFRNMARRRPEPGLAPRMLWILATAKTKQAERFGLFPALEVLLGDVRVKKNKYSAFMPGSSDIDARLKAHDIDTVLITGTATNVCCESTVRDAMLLDYKVIMLSDGTATLTEEEHAVALNTFMMFFGDVMSTARRSRGWSPSRTARLREVPGRDPRWSAAKSQAHPSST